MRLVICILVRELDRQALGRFGRHLRQDVGHPARRDLVGDFGGKANLEPLENLRRLLRLHVLVHGDEALELGEIGLLFFPGRGRDLGLDLLQLDDLGVEPFLLRLQERLAHGQLALALIELLAALGQPLEKGTLGRRNRLRVERNDDAIRNFFRLDRFCGFFFVAVFLVPVFLVRFLAVLLFRGLGRVDRAGDIRIIEHLLRPGLPHRRLLRYGRGLCRLRAQQAVGREFRRFALDPIALGQMPGAERVTALGDEAGEFQDEKRTGRHKDDRDETHVTQQSHHAAMPRTRERVRSAKACAAATIAEVSCTASASASGCGAGLDAVLGARSDLVSPRSRIAPA